MNAVVSTARDIAISIGAEVQDSLGIDRTYGHLLYRLNGSQWEKHDADNASGWVDQLLASDLPYTVEFDRIAHTAVCAPTPEQKKLLSAFTEDACVALKVTFMKQQINDTSEVNTASFAKASGEETHAGLTEKQMADMGSLFGFRFPGENEELPELL